MLVQFVQCTMGRLDDLFVLSLQRAAGGNNWKH